jgi:UPF0271 protein
MLSRMRVDLNADLGEGRDGSGPDADLMPAITSANIACGFHAGDAATMRATVALARDYGVAIGAHPSLDDREGFGRRALAVTEREVENLVAYQVGALAGIAAAEGVCLGHVKPHGALYNMAARDRALAAAVVRAVLAVDRSLLVFGLSGSLLIEAGRAVGARTVSEVFADRAYRSDGTLAPRGTPGAVMDDPQEVARRAVSMVRTRAVQAIDGTSVPLDVETICLHGDTPNAATLARALRRALEGAGIEVAPVTPIRF